MIKLNGFVQIATKMGLFFATAAELHEEWVKIEGPTIIHMQIREDPKTKQVQSIRNNDRVKERWLARGGVINVDILEPTTLDKGSKEIYEQLIGITLG